MIQDELYDVFLSHAHEDAAWVEQLAAKLADQVGLSVWLDKWVLTPGELWQVEMARGLEQARACVVCISDRTPDGWFRLEIQRGLEGDPVREAGIEGFLAEAEGVDLLSVDTVEQALAQLQVLILQGQEIWQRLRLEDREPGDDDVVDQYADGQLTVHLGGGRGGARRAPALHNIRIVL
mgnify:CR=1 FL=1